MQEIFNFFSKEYEMIVETWWNKNQKNQKNNKKSKKIKKPESKKIKKAAKNKKQYKKQMRHQSKAKKNKEKPRKVYNPQTIQTPAKIKTPWHCRPYISIYYAFIRFRDEILLHIFTRTKEKEKPQKLSFYMVQSQKSCKNKNPKK